MINYKALIANQTTSQFNINKVDKIETVKMKSTK